MPASSRQSAVRLTMVSPEFVVPDVTAAAEYYRDVFGFRILGYFLGPPVFAMVGRDAVVIHFGKPIMERRLLGICSVGAAWDSTPTFG